MNNKLITAILLAVSVLGTSCGQQRIVAGSGGASATTNTSVSSANAGTIGTEEPVIMNRQLSASPDGTIEKETTTTSGTIKEYKE